MDTELHALLLGQRKAIRQTGVVRAEAQQTGHQGAVGAVAFAGGGKAAIQADVGLHREVTQKLLGRISDLGCTRRVAGGGADHHRSQNVKQAHTMHILSYFPQKSCIPARPDRQNPSSSHFFCIFIIPLLLHLCYNNFTNV